MNDHAWMGQAACAGTALALYFDNVDDYDVAKRTCANCSVATECLAYAAKHGIDYGVWGGMTARKRHSYRIEQNGPREQGPLPMSKEHGTRWRYKTAKCRCELCRQWNRVQTANQRARARAA